MIARTDGIMMRHIRVLLIVTLVSTAVAAPKGDKPLKIFMHWSWCKVTRRVVAKPRISFPGL
jgi:hypothetical protein